MIKAGDKALDFTLPSTKGTFTLSKRVSERPVLLYFYPMDFGKTCTDYIALIDERSDDFGRMGVDLVQINPGGMDSHESWVAHTGTGFECLCDEDQAVSALYGAIIERARSESMIGKTNRAFFLVDRDMKVRFAWNAFMPTDTLPMSELFDVLRGIL